MNETYKRHLVSFAVTFFAGAAVVLLPAIETLTVSDLQSGAIVGLALAVVRGGVKAVLEMAIAKYSTNN